MSVSIKGVYETARKHHGVSDSIALTAAVFDIPRAVVCGQLGMSESHAFTTLVLRSERAKPGEIHVHTTDG